MRLAQLALVMASTLTIASPAYALQEQQPSMTVEQISDQITSLQNEYDNYTQTVQRLKDEADQLEQKLASFARTQSDVRKATSGSAAGNEQPLSAWWMIQRLTSRVRSRRTKKR